jgi:hypothetical protein
MNFYKNAIGDNIFYPVYLYLLTFQTGYVFEDIKHTSDVDKHNVEIRLKTAIKK